MAKTPKKKKDYKAIEQDQEAFEKFRYNFVMQALRRSTYRWPFHHMALQRQKIEYGLYKCESCQGAFGPKQVEKDHIVSVIPYDGFKSWDETVERMLVKSDQIQILCITCHNNKTQTENEIRKKHGQKPQRIKKITKKKRLKIIKK